MRAPLQDLIRKAVTKLKSSVPNGEVCDVVAFLTDQLAAAATRATTQQSPGARSVNLWMTPQSASDVQRWASLNNSVTMTTQSSFVSATNKICRRLGLLENPDDRDDDGLQMTLADIMWSFAEVIFDEIPAAVPSLSMACVLKFAEAAAQHAQSEAGIKDPAVPTYCNFLCHIETQTITDDVSWCARFLFHVIVAACTQCSVHRSLLTGWM